MYEKALSFFSAARSARFAFAAFVACAAFAVSGCQPQIGDKCVLNTDCSVSGTRQCDTSMPGGYCTVFNCGPNSCPDQTACYLFYAEVQGCPYSDRAPSRTAHSFCMKDCSHDSDCRPGYVCADLRGKPWYAVLLDDNQNQAVCVPAPDFASSNAGQLESVEFDASTPVPLVCQADPDIDAAFPPPPDVDAAAPSVDAASDGAPVPDAGPPPADGGLDAAIDATLDAGLDATLTDAGVDGSDAGADAGLSDATLD
jgi:hypothetical protein